MEPSFHSDDCMQSYSSSLSVESMQLSIFTVFLNPYIQLMLTAAAELASSLHKCAETPFLEVCHWNLMNMGQLAFPSHNFLGQLTASKVLKTILSIVLLLKKGESLGMRLPLLKIELFV